MSKHSENFDDENEDPTIDGFDEYPPINWDSNLEDTEEEIEAKSTFVNIYVAKEQIEQFFSIVESIINNYEEYLTIERFNRIKSKKEISLKLNNINNSKISNNFLFEHREAVNDLKNLDKITHDEVIDFYKSNIVNLKFEQFTEYDFLEK